MNGENRGDGCGWHQVRHLDEFVLCKIVAVGGQSFGDGISEGGIREPSGNGAREKCEGIVRTPRRLGDHVDRSQGLYQLPVRFEILGISERQQRDVVPPPQSKQ